MAFSILQHWQDSYSPQLLEALKDDFSPDQTEQVIDLAMATVLAHLVAQGRQQGYAELRRRLMFEAPESIWNNLDRTQLAEQIAAQVHSQGAAVFHWLDPIAEHCVLDLRQLIDQGNQSNEDVAELLENQPELLKGQAPDWVYGLAGLPELQGQAATPAAPPIDLTESIATLSGLMREAAAQPQPTATAPSAPARAGGGRWLVLVLALLVLAGLGYLYSHSKKRPAAAPAAATVPQPAAATLPETPAPAAR